ncbi:MAG TPA: hypothetical protein DHK64_04015, partial [Rhodobiaceae bacterium]|nr:hypothetical protein [Rhodobiaceae bacterium]
EGEGIFAITYSVRGQTDDPTVVVNPLSAIAPGFLRRIFEFGENMPSESQKPVLPKGKSAPSKVVPSLPNAPTAAEEGAETLVSPQSETGPAPVAPQN